MLRYRRLGDGQRRMSLSLAWKMALAAAFGNIFQGLGYEQLHAGVATTFVQTNVLFVALLSVLVLGERLRPEIAWGVALALAGITLCQWPALSGHFELSWGIVWALLAALGFSAMDLLSRNYAHQVDAMVTNVGRAAIATGLLACVPGALDQFMTMNLSQVGACALAALLGPGLARLLLINASRDLPAAESALLQQLRPPLAIPLASLAFGSWPSSWEWWGSALVTAGVVVPLSLSMGRRGSLDKPTRN